MLACTALVGVVAIAGACAPKFRQLSLTYHDEAAHP
jgi:hypothetical protein